MSGYEVCKWRRPSGVRFRPRGGLGHETKWLRVLTPGGHVDMGGRMHLGYCPWCVVTRDGSSRVWPDHWSYEEYLMAVSRKKVNEANVTTTPAVVTSEYLGYFVHIIEHLAVRVYADHTVRTPGTVHISMIGAVWKAVWKDPDSGQQLPILAPTLDLLLETSEAALGAPETPWEPDPWAKQSKKRK